MIEPLAVGPVNKVASPYPGTVTESRLVCFDVYLWGCVSIGDQRYHHTVDTGPRAVN